MLAREVGKLLRERGLTIAVAESCTGGKLGDMITSVSGSSEYFLGGIISYSNHAKMDLLGVHGSTLVTKGAVSGDTAKQMAAGARKALRAKVGVGITGIAGPTGGTRKKPVGLVYIAVSSDKGVYCTKNLFRGTRKQIKIEATNRALEMTKQFLLRKY